MRSTTGLICISSTTDGQIDRGGRRRDVRLSASSTMRDRGALRAQVRTVGSACQRAGVTLVLGGFGSWPDPPPFGVRVERWDQFNALIRREHP
jgi:hypothetical protein